MGNNPQVSNMWFNRAEWEKVDTKGNYDILRNKAESSSAQEYVCNYFEEKDIYQDFDIYKLRLDDLPNVVRFYWASLFRAGTCSMSSVKVVTERIPTLLSDVKDLSEPQAFKVLEDALRGFEAINKKFAKNFAVSAPMVGFNENREVRVWLNRDFSHNEAEFTRVKEDREHNIINSLLDVIEQSIEGGTFPGYFNHEKAKVRSPYRFGEMRPLIEYFNRNYVALRSNVQPAPEASFRSSSSFLPVRPNY